MEARSKPAAATPDREVEQALQRLASRKDDWVRVGIPERIDYLRRCAAGVLEVADEWVRRACEATGIDPASPLAGEPSTSGPMVTARTVRLLRETLEHDARPAPASLRTDEAGRQIATVLPANLLDRILFRGHRAEVWIEPGKPASQGRIYRDKLASRFAPGRVALVLGAGNIASIPPTDALHKLFVEDQVVVIKMNPVNEYLGPLLARALRCLIDDGFLAIVHGGAETGARLCNDPRVDTLHLTGSDRTYDAIVWGATAEERARRRAAGEPLLDKPFTAELGCVTPVLVVPGPWSERDLEFQGRHVASMVSHNASFNCTAAKVLVTASGWDKREAFLRSVERGLSGAPAREPYYPGAHERYRGFVERYPAARRLGGGELPWTLLPDVPARRGEYALSHEAFCGVLADVALDASTAGEFLQRAVDFANEDVWGTLSCVLLIDPKTAARNAAALERAIAGLRYGGIAVNCWSGINFALGVTSWGAFPGHTREEIGSGVGTVHNTYLFDHPERSVVYGPFRPFPKPIYSHDYRTLRTVARRMTRLEARPSWLALPGILWAGLSA